MLVKCKVLQQVAAIRIILSPLPLTERVKSFYTWLIRETRVNSNRKTYIAVTGHKPFERLEF